jgi:glycosyltransferase involved in cell wall biosynthesis
MTAVSVIVPARDAAATLGATLRALQAQDLDARFEVLVVDDGSRDATAQIAQDAQAAGAPVRLLRMEHSAGAGSVRNHGAAAARGAVLAFTDADCMPAPGWLRAGLRALEGGDLVQGAVRPDPAAAMGPYDRSLSVTGERGFYESANLFVRRELFERVGGFEDVIGRARRPQGEDALFGWRVRRAGGRTAFCEQALVHHAVFPRGPVAWVLDRRRWRHLPTVVRHVPELRGHLCYRRWFYEHRTATFDAALAGVGLSALARRRRAGRLAQVLPLALAWPYARVALQEARRLGPRRAAGYLPARVAADAVALASLTAGSAAARSVLL